MIHVEQKISCEDQFAWENFAPRERVVFLDIETTGLKAAASSLYLIGLADYCGDSWRLQQFFAESRAEEPKLLRSLSDFLKEKRTEQKQDHLVLISYNGDHFDLPYLKEIEREYGDFGLFRDTVSFDLLKAIRPCKKLAGLTDMKLKTVESCCGIRREDKYGGGDLIYVYEEFLRLSNVPGGGCEDTELNGRLREELLRCLLLHNAEDIADMIPVMKMLSYDYLIQGGYGFRTAEEIQSGKTDFPSALNLRFRLKEPLPKELYRETEDYVISVSGKDPFLMEIALQLVHTDLRLYYPDYKNYYYLPAEDEAIHCSLGEFVDRKNRVRATAQTCYTREEGLFFFLPSRAEFSVPRFFRTYKGKPYAKYSREMLGDEAFWMNYAAFLLKELPDSTACHSYSSGL